MPEFPVTLEHPGDTLKEFTVGELDRRIDANMTTINNYLRGSLELAWDTGWLLRERRERSTRGEWTEYLDRLPCPRGRAFRMIRLTEHDSAAIRKYTSITAAVNALPKPGAENGQQEEPPNGQAFQGEVVAPDGRRLSAAEKRLRERQRLQDQVMRAEEARIEAERERDNANQKLRHFQQEEAQSAGFQRSVSVIENLQEENRTLRHDISKKDDEIAGLKRELTAQRKRFRDLKRKYDELESGVENMRDRHFEPGQPAGDGEQPPEYDLTEYDEPDDEAAW